MTAGPCLCAVYEELNTTLIVVLLNCKTLEARWKEAESLIKWAKIRVDNEK